MPRRRVDALAVPADPLPQDQPDPSGAAPPADPGEIPAGPPDPAAGPPRPTHRRRVRMLVDVVDHPDEVTYVTALFEERGWSVRPAGPDDDAASPTGRRATLVVEVRLHGARFGAVRTAVAEVERLALQAELGAWVRDAALVEHERPPRTTYQLHRAVPSAGRIRRAVARVWTWLGAADEQRAVTVPAGPGSRQAAQEELAARTLGGRAFDSTRHGLRVPGHSDAGPPHAETPHGRRVHLAWLAGGAAGIVLAVVCGMGVVWADGWWKVLPAVLGTAGALPLGRMAKETRERGRPAQWAAGLAGTTALAGFGALVGRDTEPRVLGAGLVLLAGVAFTGTGVVLAVRRTFFTRHAAWLVPLSVPVVWSMVSWVGRQMHAAYLDRFDIRPEAVPTPALGTYTAAAQPMALALGSVLFFVAIAGWLRHFHVGRDRANRLFAIALVTLLSFVYVVTSITLGTRQAVGAAGRAAEHAAERNAEPPSYHGLWGRFVCVRPLSERIPVEYGPVTTGHPVVTFGASGDWMWLWDPARPGGPVPESFALRREDVALLPAENPVPKRCPAA
ncbi:hypothetical protein GCM10027074_07770 [Streptomyces deserti]